MLTPEDLKELKEAYRRAPGKMWHFEGSELCCEDGSLGGVATCQSVHEFIELAFNGFESLLSAAEENAALKQQLSASEWIRKDNALRTYDGLTEQLAEARARVAELEAALTNAVDTLSRINSIRGGFHGYDDSTPYGRGLGDGQKVSADYAKNCLAAIAPEALSRTPGDALKRLQALEKVAEAASLDLRRAVKDFDDAKGER